MINTRLSRCLFIGVLLVLGQALLSLSAAETSPSRPAAKSEKVLVPTRSWDCGMPGGIPAPEKGALVFDATLQIEQIHDVGLTPYGQRKAIVLQGGKITGEKIGGAVMAGSLDFQLGFANGALEIEQVLVLRTEDGKYIYVRGAGIAADAGDVRVVLDFEAPTGGNYTWLNTGRYVGRRQLDPTAKTMRLAVYDVGAVPVATAPSDRVQITKPAGLPDQPWDYRRMAPNEQRGPQLIVENVTLGGSQSVGPTKNGGRNIIPITGGTLSGKITGKVLFGGADYQKQANPFTLDARYLWQTDEGDVIIVRNAGPIAQLVPTFEVRTDSKYAWLNKGSYLSSSPGVGAGGVSLTFYESTLSADPAEKKP